MTSNPQRDIRFSRRRSRPAGKGKPSGEVTPGGQAALAQTALSTIEPLVELLLELGISSPEAESLLRSLFVHKARAWLASQDGGVVPSDARIALVTGIHRNFVRTILSDRAMIAAERQRKGHRASKLLEVWFTDPAYLDSGGKPRDLPEKGPSPSFEHLVEHHVPGAATGVVMRELHRSGVIQLLSDHRVRVRSRSMRPAGLNRRSVAELSAQLLETLHHNLRRPQDRLLVESLPAIELDASRLPLVREVINRRTSAFLQALEQELAAESARARWMVGKATKTKKLSLTIFESKG